jgi:orotate phosphoribosyltransferase
LQRTERTSTVTAMNRTELAAAISSVARLKGEFKLRSGATSAEYFDKYRFESSPELLRAIARQLVALVPPGTEVLAGLELGGVPIATALSLETGVPVVFVRKAAKTYGTCRLAEGAEVQGRRVLVVEDVVTSGGQVVTSTQELRSLGAIIDSALCVIDREAEGARALSAISVKLLPLFTKSQLEGAAPSLH